MTKKQIRIDISALKVSRDFRLIFSAGVISNFGSMMTYVAMPFQIKEITNSYHALHNDRAKQQVRQEMLTGQRPKECGYCWNMEDVNNNIISLSNKWFIF